MKIYSHVKVFLIVLIMCIAIVPFSRFISPRAQVDASEIFLAWLPFSVSLAMLLLFGRRAIFPLVVGFALVYERLLDLNLLQTGVFLFCFFFPLLLSCTIVRWQLGTRWRYGLPNRHMGVRTVWLAFVAPAAIKATMYIAGAKVAFPTPMARFFDTSSVIYSIIDIQSLICAALIFTMMFYYPLRMMVNPRYGRTLWRKSLRPFLSPRRRNFTLGWLLTLALFLIVVCSPFDLLQLP